MPIDWQPIETAPKDGTWVLLYKALDNGQPKVMEAIRIMPCDRWVSTWDGHRIYDPTHWAPINLPDTETKENRNAG